MPSSPSPWVWASAGQVSALLGCRSPKACFLLDFLAPASSGACFGKDLLWSLFEEGSHPTLPCFPAPFVIRNIRISFYNHGSLSGRREELACSVIPKVEGRRWVSGLTRRSVSEPSLRHRHWGPAYSSFYISLSWSLVHRQHWRNICCLRIGMNIELLCLGMMKSPLCVRRWSDL